MANEYKTQRKYGSVIASVLSSAVMAAYSLLPAGCASFQPVPREQSATIGLLKTQDGLVLRTGNKKSVVAGNKVYSHQDVQKVEDALKRDGYQLRERFDSKEGYLVSQWIKPGTTNETNVTYTAPEKASGKIKLNLDDFFEYNGYRVPVHAPGKRVDGMDFLSSGQTAIAFPEGRNYTSSAKGEAGVKEVLEEQVKRNVIWDSKLKGFIDNTNNVQKVYNDLIAQAEYIAQNPKQSESKTEAVAAPVSVEPSKPVQTEEDSGVSNYIKYLKGIQFQQKTDSVPLIAEPSRSAQKEPQQAGPAVAVADGTPVFGIKINFGSLKEIPIGLAKGIVRTGYDLTQPLHPYHRFTEEGKRIVNAAGEPAGIYAPFWRFLGDWQDEGLVGTLFDKNDGGWFGGYDRETWDSKATRPLGLILMGVAASSGLGGGHGGKSGTAESEVTFGRPASSEGRTGGRDEGRDSGNDSGTTGGYNPGNGGSAGN